MNAEQQQVINQNAMTFYAGMWESYRAGRAGKSPENYPFVHTVKLSDLEWSLRPNGTSLQSTVQFDGFTATLIMPDGTHHPCWMIAVEYSHISGEPIVFLSELDELDEVASNALVVDVDGHGLHVIAAVDISFKRESYTLYHPYGDEGQTVVREMCNLKRTVKNGKLIFTLVKISDGIGYPEPLLHEKKIGAYVEAIEFVPEQMADTTIVAPDFKFK